MAEKQDGAGGLISRACVVLSDPAQLIGREGLARGGSCGVYFDELGIVFIYYIVLHCPLAELGGELLYFLARGSGEAFFRCRVDDRLDMVGFNIRHLHFSCFLVKMIPRGIIVLDAALRDLRIVLVHPLVADACNGYIIKLRDPARVYDLFECLESVGLTFEGSDKDALFLAVFSSCSHLRDPGLSASSICFKHGAHAVGALQGLGGGGLGLLLAAEPAEDATVFYFFFAFLTGHRAPFGYSFS